MPTPLQIETQQLVTTITAPTVLDLSFSPVSVTVLDIQYSPAVVNVVSTGPGGSGAVAHPASVPISGGRLVRLTDTGLTYYDAANPAHAYSLLGVSLNAASAGGSVSVQSEGSITHTGWSLTPGELYRAGPDGVLQIAPTGTVFTQIIGYASDADTLNFNPQPLIFNL